MSRLAHTFSLGAAAAFAALIGCSTEAVVEQRTQALEGVDGGAMCTADDVSWPDGAPASEQVCSGPWTFMQTRACYGRFDTCGLVPCTDYNICAIPESWGGSRITKYTGVYKKTYIAHMEYEPMGRGGPRKPTLMPSLAWMESQCAGRLASKKSAIAAATTSLWAPDVTSPPPFNKIVHSGSWWNLNLKSKVGATHTYECSYRVKYRQIRIAKYEQCGCSYEQPNRLCLDYQPSCGEERLFTGYGVAKSSVPAPPSLHRTAVRHGLACTTCEGVPAGDPQGKFDCLHDRLTGGPLPSPSAPAEQAIVQHIKLVYELYADQLTEAQRSIARDLYAEYPDWAPECGPANYAALDADCAKRVEDDGLFGPLSACQRMRYQGVTDPITFEPSLYSHVPRAVVEHELDPCAAAFERASELDGECRDQYEAALVDINADLVDRTFEAIEDDGAGALTSLGQSLGHIDTWYGHAANAWTDDPATLRANLSAVLSLFWERVHTVANPLPPEFTVGDEVAAQALLDEVAATGLDADRQVLAAAYADPAPLQTAPLLYVTADALRSLSDRLTDVGAIQDAACRYVDCAGRTTEVSELWDAIAALRDPAALDDALVAATHIRPEYAAVFTAIRDRNAALEAAFADADNAMAVDLLDVIASAAQRSALFAEHGMFSAAPNNVLNAGIQEENRLAIQNNLDAAVSRLTGAVASYRSERTNLVNNYLAVLRNGAEIDDIGHRIVEVLRRGMHAGLDMEQLRIQGDVAEQSIGTFAEAFETLIESEAVDGDMYVQTDILPLLELNAAEDTHYDPAMEEVWVSDIAVQADEGGVWTLDVEKGDIVRFGVSGTWSPSCAVEKQYGPLPIAAETGSEGYMMQHVDGTTSAQSYQSSHETYTQSDTSTKTCYGFGAEANLFQFLDAGGAGLFSLSASASWNKCTTESEGTRSSTGFTNSETQSSSTNARFGGGLRAAGTPIPGAAGALFLVATNQPGDPEAPDAIRDLMVVRPNGLFVADRSLRLYLVVNDRNDCETLSPIGPLVVSPRVMRPLGAVVESLGEAMGDTLVALRDERIHQLEQATQLSSAELASLKADANQRLALACDCDITQYPPILRSFFDAWIDHEVARLSRAVQINALERELELVELKLQGLEDDLNNAKQRGRLARLLPRWSLQNLSGDELGREADRMTRVLNGMLHPVMHLRYPNALDAFRVDNEALIDDLIDVDFTASFDEHAHDLATLAGALSIALDDGDITANNTLVKFAVKYPRPADIEILSPAEGDEIGDGTTVAVRVAFPPNVQQVEVYLDESLLGIDDAFPFQLEIAGAIEPGEHTLLVASRDLGGEIIANAEITVAGPEAPCEPNPLLGIECPEECEPNPLLGIECPDEGDETAGDTGDDASIVFAVANENAAKLAWDGVFSLGTAKFVVSPEDVYDAGVFSPLLCGDTVPVIQSMSVFAVADKDAETLNAQNMRLDAEIDPYMQFPDVAGPNRYVMENADFVTLLGAPIRFGRNESDALTTHSTWAAPLRFANGLSPFTTFSVDFSKFADLDPTFWDNAEAFVLVFELDARHSGAGLPWLAPCL